MCNAKRYRYPSEYTSRKKPGKTLDPDNNGKREEQLFPTIKNKEKKGFSYFYSLLVFLLYRHSAIPQVNCFKESKAKKFSPLLSH
jgi:hypothetical protein